MATTSIPQEVSTGLLRITRHGRITSVLAWLLALSFAGGSDLLPVNIGGATFYLFRWAALLIAFLGILDLLSVRAFASRWITALFTVMAFWLLWALIPIAAITDYHAWQKDVFYLFMGACTLLSIHHLLACGRSKELLHGSMAGLAVNLILGIVQMLTSIQPQSSHANDLIQYSSEHFVRLSPVGMFGNPNHFAFYLCTHLLLMVYFRRSIRREFFIGVFAVASLLLFMTSSKIAFIAWVVITMYALLSDRNQLPLLWSRYRIAIAGGVLLLMALYSSIEWKNTRELALAHEREIGAAKAIKAQSSASRMAMFVCGTEAVKSSNGLGIGAGQFASFVRHGKCSAEAGGMTNAHAGVIEIGAQYGVLILTLIALLYGYLILILYGTSAAPWSWCYTIALALLQMANSSFLASPVSWVMLALPMFVLFDQKQKAS